MIKQTFKNFLDTFSLSQLRTDFNRFFFHGLLFIVISIIALFANQYIANALFDRFNDSDGLFENLYEMVLRDQGNGQVATQLTSFMMFHTYFVYQFRHNELKLNALGPQSMQYYFCGLGILLAANLIFSAGFSYMVENRYAYSIASRHLLGQWINYILQIFVPLLGMYLSVLFLRKLLQVKSESNQLAYYFKIAFITYVLCAVLFHFTLILSTLLIQPLVYLLRTPEILIVFTCFIVVVLTNLSLIIQTYFAEAIVSQTSPNSKMQYANSGDVIDQL
ncbi:MAG TPA: hypothetical protein VD905_20155 [Flavobacteriales bacterium]|nr:hypothetical protein [Flavobacteriales bacterium]